MDNIQYKYQGDDTKLCGQAVLAMLLDIEISEVCEIMGKTGGTYNTDIKAVLDGFDIKYSYRRNSKFNIEAEIAIVKVGFSDAPTTHWTLKVGDKYYDPSEGIVEGYDERVCSLSYIKIK